MLPAILELFELASEAGALSGAGRLAAKGAEKVLGKKLGGKLSRGIGKMFTNVANER